MLLVVLRERTRFSGVSGSSPLYSRREILSETHVDKSSTEKVIRRLEEAIDCASTDDVGSSASGADLIATAGEALGALRVLGSVSMTQILYDFARLAGMAGQVPDDFEAKSKGVA